MALSKSPVHPDLPGAIGHVSIYDVQENPLVNIEGLRCIVRAVRQCDRARQVEPFQLANVGVIERRYTVAE